MAIDEFVARRRQVFLAYDSYVNTLNSLLEEQSELAERITRGGLTPQGYTTARNLLAWGEWYIFQLRYTAGVDLQLLATSLDRVVAEFERYKEALHQDPDTEDQSPFDIDGDSIDQYVDYINLLSACLLLDRSDLIIRVAGLLVHTEYYQADAIVEEFLKHFMQGRPELDEWFWEKPYKWLMESIDGESPEDSAAAMAKYTRKWYPAMRGKAEFWNSHEKSTAEYTTYIGYWAMCAAAFTYLLNIDDSAYCDEVVYPKELIAFARAMAHAKATDSYPVPSRVEGGTVCPHSGFWFTPAKAGSRSYFKQGETMPQFDQAKFGITIWQREGEND